MHTAKIMLRRHSFGELSMTKLAFQTGLSRATIYDQFNDKFHLFREVVKNTIDELSLEYKIELNLGMELDDAMKFYCLLLVDFHSDTRTTDLRRIMMLDGETQPWICEQFNLLVQRPIATSFEIYLFRKFAGSFPCGRIPSFVARLLWDLTSGLVERESRKGEHVLPDGRDSGEIDHIISLAKRAVMAEI